MSIDFQFDYLSKYPEKKDKLKNMHLLAYDGLNIPLERIDDRLYFDAPLIDVNNDVYVIPFSRWPFILNRAHEKSRQDILREKFNTRDKICEYYFLLNGKYSPKSLYVFTEEHGFQDGWYLKVVGVIEYDSFTWQEEPIIKPMLSQAFHFMHQHEPEFQYSCSDDLFKIHTSYDVEVKLKETYPELDKYSLENISKVISYATTHSTMNLNEISQITSIAPEDVRTILGATFIMWNH